MPIPKIPVVAFDSAPERVRAFVSWAIGGGVRGQTQRDAFAAVLECSPEDIQTIVAGMLEVRGEVEKCIEMCGEMADKRKADAYRDAYTAIVLPFSKLSLPGSMNDISHGWNDGTVRELGLASIDLDAVCAKRKVIERGDLELLLNDLDELEKLVRGTEVDGSLRILLLECTAQMRAAINGYAVCGSPYIEKSVARMAGFWGMYAKEMQPEVRTKIGAAISRTVTVLKDIGALVALTANTKKLLEDGTVGQ